MRILTHNSLKCPAKDVATGYPLKLVVEEMTVIETECNFDFLKSHLPSLNWEGVLIAADAIGLKDIPPHLDSSHLLDEDFLMAMHNLLLDIHIVKGSLVCGESGRVFPIVDGIPDMM